MTSAPLRLSRVSTAAAIIAVLAAAPAAAAGYLKFGDLKGNVPAGESKGGQIELESWSFSVVNSGTHASKGMALKGKTVSENSGAGGIKGGGTVEREMKESGEKGGTEDINIGVGELQEVTITKSMDMAPPTTGSRGSMTAIVPAGTCRVGARYPTAELGTGRRVYKMTGVVVTHCSAARSGDGSIPTETLSLNFDKVTWK